MYSIKENLETLMKQKNISLTQLANNLKMPYKTLSNYINEKFLPSLNTAIKIADYFNCSLDYLCGITEENNHKNFTNNNQILFLTRYNKLLIENNVSHYRLCKDLELNINISRKWKSGSIPSLSILIDISNYFSVSIDYLVGRSNKK